MTEPDAALALSAPLALERAPGLCRVDPQSGESCAWNHGLWQILRLLGLVLTPAHHAAFFRAALQALPERDEPLRILVSGSADYAMLAEVLGALGERRPAVRVTVLDICESPLMLNRWYAGRAVREIETLCSDILACPADGGFDAICTHAFLSMLPAAQRPALYAKWAQLLRPGGVVITVNRLRPAHAGAEVRFGERDTAAYRALVRERAASLPAGLGIDPDWLVSAAGRYAERLRVFPLHTSDEVAQGLECAGFRIAHISCAPIASGAQDAVTAPTVPGGAQYLRVSAERR